MPREMSKELCLWPPLLFLSELLAGLYLWLFTKKHAEFEKLWKVGGERQVNKGTETLVSEGCLGALQ